MLVEGVESGRSLSPVFSLPSSSVHFLLSFFFLLNGLLDGVSPVFNRAGELLDQGFVVLDVLSLNVGWDVGNFYSNVSICLLNGD